MTDATKLIERLRDVVEEETGYGVRNEAADMIEQQVARIAELEARIAANGADPVALPKDGDSEATRAAFRAYDAEYPVAQRSNWQIWRDAIAYAASIAAPVADSAMAKDADTGHKEADRIVNRLMSSDPQFDDCSDAADLIRKLVADQRSLSQELQAALSDDSAKDATRYRKCREHGVKRGDFEKPEDYDAMVDESIERMEVKFRKGHNYGKKMQPDGTLKAPEAAIAASAETGDKA